MAEEMSQRQDPDGTARFLTTAAEELSALRARSEAAAARISEAAPSAARLAGEDAITAELADSLVSKSAEMAAECRRLSLLLDRVSAAHAARAAEQPAREPGEASAEQPPRGGNEDDVVAVSASRAPEAPPVAPGPGASAPGQGEQPSAGGDRAEAEAAAALGFEPEAAGREAAAADSEPAGAASAAGPGAGEPAGVSEGVRLLVTQMAVAGAGWEEIERRLVSDFGISEPGAVLRELFGER